MVKSIKLHNESMKWYVYKIMCLHCDGIKDKNHMRVHIHTKIKCPYLSERKNQICPSTVTNGTHVRNKFLDQKQLQILLD